MTEPVNVVFSISERGFDKILKDVEALRGDLEGLGVDMSAVQRRLNGIETTATRTGTQIRRTGKVSDDAAKSSRGWAESLTTVWARQFREAERAEAQIRKVKAAQDAAAGSTRVAGNLSGIPSNTSSPRVGASFGNIVDQDAKAAEQASRAYSNLSTQIDDAIESRKRMAQAFSRSLQGQIREEVAATREQQIATRQAATEAERLNRVQDETTNPSTRYALYDVANAYTAVGVALSGVAIYAGVVGAEFQSAFTNVARTTTPLAATDEYLQTVRNSLVQLSGQIPLTFSELSEIATIGNQMGIAEDRLVDFTGTIARFASVSGVSIEEVTRSFGGFIAQTGLSEEYLENLGSAMALVSINSNATEAQIISLTREIAASANSAGFSADEIVGLAGAFASLQVAPERARGVLDTYFDRLTSAVSEGGESLAAFSRVTGLAGEEISKLVRSGEGVTVFRSVLSGLAANSADVVELDQNLDSLGLTGLRANNTFLRFANALGVADSSFADARQGFIEGAELNRQYTQTVDDLASQFTILISGINALIDAVSGGGVESLASLLELVNNIIFGFTEWVGNNRIVAGIIGFAIAVAGITGAMFLVRAGLVAATAATFAMRTAIFQMGGTALAAAGTMRGLAGAMFGVKGATDAASGSLLTLRTVLRSLLASTGIGLLLVGLGFAADALIGTGTKANDAALSLDEYEKATKFSGIGSDGAASSADNLADSLGGGGGNGGVAGAAEAAAVKVRTLVDYVNDLNGVFRRSEDIRFGSQAALDEITLKWLDLNEEIEKYQSQVRSLTADRNLKAYFLGIAEAYDDQLRAGELREDIAKIDEDLAKAQAGASTELNGNSRAAIENRKAFRNLLGSYEDYVSALASAGASQEQIQKVISQLNGDFQSQATALGFNSNELINYNQRFSDLSTVVARMPRDITVGFNGDPALQALSEFFAKATEDARTAGQQAGDAYGDGLGGSGGIGGLGDTLVANSRAGVGRAGDTLWNLFWEAMGGDTESATKLNVEVERFFLDVGENLRNFFQGIGDFFAGIGTYISDWFGEQLDEIGQLLSDPLSFLPKWFNEQLAELGIIAPTAGARVGAGVSSGLKAGLGNSLNNGTDPLGNWASRQNPYGRGLSLGSNIGGGLVDGINIALGGRSIKGTGSSSLKFGFAGGGYTGAGHWLEPAGVVHRGEYVIPKKHVDQRTGLPDANYVSNLQRGRSAPKTGYATGGFVGGGGQGPIELGPASLGAILNGLSVSMNVGREQLAKATSGGNSRLAFTGSN